MAANKRKILDAARKYVQKGAKDRALKEYEKLVQLDPRDAKLRLEIGDAHRRWGNVEEAIAAYVRVAEQYTKEGFDARAVAVYKQIQNLDPDRHAIYEPLAELYQRMGLTAEAIHALQTAADGFHREGNKRQALELLQKMASIDPSNTGSRIKVADLLRQEGLLEEAVGEYEQAAQELRRQGESETSVTIYERILEIEPERRDALESTARLLVERNVPERAEPYAKRLLDLDPSRVEGFELLAEIYRGLQRDDDLVDVYRRLAELYEQRGDEEQARAIRQRYLPPDGLDAEAIELGEETVLEEPALPELGASEPGLEGLEGDELLDEELLEDEILEEASPLAGSEPAAARPAPEPSVSQAGSESAPPKAAPTPPDPDADPEQLLAEASVYLRYGKRDQAVVNLEAVLARDPRCRPALEKLGEAYADGGEGARAVEQWLLAAEVAGQEGDTAGRGVLRDRIAALDEAAAARLDAESQAESQADPEPESAAAPAEVEPPPDALDTADFDEIEIDIDEESFRGEAPSGPEAPTVEDAALDTADFDGASASASTSVSQRVTEDLEEAEFYLHQGLKEEAEAIYQRLREMAPNHPLVQVRLGEIAAARGEDPGASGTNLRVDPGAAASADADAAPGETPLGLDDADADDWLSEPQADAEPGTPGGDDQLEFTAPDPEISADDLATDDLGEPGDLDVPPAAERGGEADFDPASDSAAPASPEASFDLAAALNEEFDDSDPGASTSGRLGSTADDFAAVFSEFKKGVSRTLSDSDYQAHFDLGIAYREMGLAADALGEFEAASGSDGLRVECLHLMGLCALDQEQPAAAVGHLERALAEPEAAPEQRLAARFALGRAFEALGETARAREAWEAVAAEDPGFCEVEERLEALRQAEEAKQADDSRDAGGSGDSLFEEDDTGEFESFDDLIAEPEGSADAAEADAAPPAAEEQSFEDFADLTGEDDDDADANAEPAAGPEPAAAAAETEAILVDVDDDAPDASEPLAGADAEEPEAPAEPEPPAGAETIDEGPGETPAEAPPAPEPPRRRKKKISFV